MIPFGLAFQLLGISTLTGTRSALTLFVCMVGGALGWVEVPPDLAWATSAPALAAVFALVVVEELLEREHEFGDLLAVLRYGTSGAAGFVAASGLAHVYEAMGQGYVPPEWVAGIVGVLLAMATFHLRRRVHARVAEVTAGIGGPRKWLSRLELASVVALGGTVLLAPLAGVLFVAVAAFASAALIVLGKALEQRKRRRCPACGYRARVEASVCASCRGALAVEERLAGGWRLAI